jgi:hypothetical protein
MTSGKPKSKREVSPPVPAQTTSKAVPSDIPHRLRCLIEGDTSTFSVDISFGSEIEDLKKLIHKKGIEDERSVLAKDLTLLKVRNTTLSSIH